MLEPTRGQAALWGALLLGGAAALRGQAVAPTSRVLTNGLQVLVVEDHRQPLATVLLAVRGGAFAQDAGQEGLAHLYEHIIFRAYRGDPNRFPSEAEKLEGGYNGETDDEYSAYFLSVPADKAIKAISLLGDLIQHVTFNDADLKAERPIVLNELQRDVSTPEANLARNVDSSLWGRSWSWKDVAGDSVSLAHLGAADLKAGFGRYYIPNNSVLIVTGDVKTEAVLERAEREFGGWQRGPDPLEGRARISAEAMTRTAIVVRSDVVQDVTVVVRLVGPATPDTLGTVSAEELVEVFNGRSSAFQRRLVTDGPFESIFAGFDPRVHGGPITFRGTVLPGRAKEAIDQLLGELDDLERLDGVTDQDLTIARRHEAVEEAISRDAGANLPQRLAFTWATTGLGYGLGRTSTDSVTLPDLKHTAARYVAQHGRSIGILAPPATADSILTWLRKVFHQ